MYSVTQKRSYTRGSSFRAKSGSGQGQKPATGRGLNTAAKVEVGTRLYYLRSDGRSFVDMMTEQGICCRMYVSGRGEAQTVNGMPVGDCFDGVIYN